MRKDGFTLIELMVVIAIIAALAAVITPQVFRQVEKGRVASVEAFYNSVKLAAMAYFADMGSWPVQGSWCAGENVSGWPNCNTLSPGFVIGPAGTNWDGPYLDRWPNENATPWGMAGYRWWDQLSTDFGPSLANERGLWLVLPTQAAQRIDQHIDGSLGSNSGKVQAQGDPPTWPPTGNVNLQMLISRDGPVS